MEGSLSHTQLTLFIVVIFVIPSLIHILRNPATTRAQSILVLTLGTLAALTSFIFKPPVADAVAFVLVFPAFIIFLKQSPDLKRLAPRPVFLIMLTIVIISALLSPLFI